MLPAWCQELGRGRVESGMTTPLESFASRALTAQHPGCLLSPTPDGAACDSEQSVLLVCLLNDHGHILGKLQVFLPPPRSASSLT